MRAPDSQSPARPLLIPHRERLLRSRGDETPASNADKYAYFTRVGVVRCISYSLRMPCQSDSRTLNSDTLRCFS